MRLGEWAERGACVHADPSVFHPERGDTTEPAKAICACCPVQPECLEHALRWEADGVWGGLSEVELQARRRELGIPDPPRITVAALHRDERGAA